MKIHFLPPPPPPAPPAPPKAMPTLFEVDHKTQELIATAQQERSQRLKRDKLFENRKKSLDGKSSLNSNPEDGKTANPDDPIFDILA